MILEPTRWALSRSVHVWALLLLGGMVFSTAAWAMSPAATGPEQALPQWLEQARQLERDRQFEEAIAAYRKALKRHPENDEIRGHLARLLSWQGHLDESIELYRDIVSRHPADVDIRVALARVLSWHKQFAESERQYREVLAEKPTYADAMRGLADTLAWSGRPGEALPLYEALYRQRQDPQLAQRIDVVKADVAAAERSSAQAMLDEQVVQARATAWSHQYDEAIEQYRAVLNQDPDNIEATRGLADVLAWSHRPSDALPLYETVFSATQEAKIAERILAMKAEIAQQTRSSAQAALGAQIAEARQAAWGGHYEEAIHQYRAVLSQDPAHVEAKQGLADTLYWSRRYSEALPLYEEVYAKSEDPALLARIEAVKTEIYLSARAPVSRPGGGIAIPFRDYLKVGYGHYTYTRNYPDERNWLIEAAKPIGNLTLITRVEPLNRFGLHDTPLSSELYSPLWRGAWGYVGGSATINPQFVPSWSVGGEVAQGLGALSPKLRFLEVSFGYKRLAFRSAGVDLLSPGLTIYFPWSIWLTEKISYVPEQGSITLASQLTWRPKDRVQVFVSGGYGTSGERINSVQDFTRVKSTIWQGGLIFPIAEKLSGELSGYYEDRGYLYVRRGLSFNLIWHW